MLSKYCLTGLPILALACTALSCVAQEQRPVASDKKVIIARGKMLFVKASCWGCHPHGENSLNGDKPLKGPGFEKRYKSDQSIIDFVRHGSPDFGMPPFPREKLSDGDLKTIIVFIRSLSDAK